MARTRLTAVTVTAGGAPLARTRLTRVSVTASEPSQGRTRLTGLTVTAGGPPTTIARTRITEISVTSKATAAFAHTRLTDLEVEVGAAYQSAAALPTVFYLDAENAYRPYQLLTMADYPW